MTTLTKVKKSPKMTARQIKMIKELISHNKRRFEFLQENHGDLHAMSVHKERISFWSSKLPA